jgi:hypothetical protein
MGFLTDLGLGIAGDVIGGLFGTKQAQKQMDFQAQQSATSYQRAVQDLRAAGLNPILAGTVGGASTPSGVMAPTPQFGTTALAQKRLNQEIKNLKAQEKNLNAQTDAIAGGVTSKVGGTDLYNQIKTNIKNIKKVPEIIKKVKEGKSSNAKEVKDLEQYYRNYNRNKPF